MRAIHPIAVLVAALSVPHVALAQSQARIPQGPAGTVTLPIAEYNRLIDRAAQPDTTPAPPPVAAVVGRADLRARVAGETARGTLRLEGEVFQRGQVKVPLVSGATLADARSEGRPLPLLHESDSHVAVLPGPAPFIVTLEWAAPVTSAPGRAMFTLPVPAAGSASATLDLPGDPANVRVEGGLVTRRQAAAGRTTLDVTLEPGRRTEVSWSVRETAAPPATTATRTLADVKSLVTIGDADLRMVSLVEVTVVQGEPRTFEVRIPAGFEVSSMTGNSIETSAPAAAGGVTITVRDPATRRHQFLVGLERAHATGSFKTDVSFPTLAGAQREIGEAAIEGGGTIDVNATGDEGLRRMDVRETHAALRALGRQPLLAAFRYQRRPDEARVLALDVKRFADAPILAAVADRVAATTLVTAEGRTLTEVVLSIRNSAQPFMKVTVPPGATMLSVEVAGEAAKPVEGADGTRVPLLRAGFRPESAYKVSFVYINAGEAFAKKGDTQIALPKFDVPVTVLEWELFLPDRYSAAASGGNVIPARLLPQGIGLQAESGRVWTDSGNAYRANRGEVAGTIVDASGAALPGVTVIVTGADRVSRRAQTDAGGLYVVRGVPSGPVTAIGELAGFVPLRHSFEYDRDRPRPINMQLAIAGITETVQVSAASRAIAELPLQNAPSQNVLNLQRRVAGVLPVRVDVPRSGTSYLFVRPLVLDEETMVMFRYKRR